MDEHTPGPWTLKLQRGRGNSRGRLFVRAASNDYVAIAHVCQRVERDENARLIAAAPQMLDALRAAALALAGADASRQPIYWQVDAAIHRATTGTDREVPPHGGLHGRDDG